MKIVEIIDPTPIVSGAYLTGRIEKVTDYEKVDPGRWVKRGDHREPETFVGEQSVVLTLKGKGLVVFTGCAHLGVVNTVKHAQKITGGYEGSCDLGRVSFDGRQGRDHSENSCRYQSNGSRLRYTNALYRI